jgi:3D (Asp-Asp-Asp) domain-containing protein
MYSGDAVSGDSSHGGRGKNNQTKSEKTSKSYFAVILLLFVMVLTLCINNYKMFKSYDKTKNSLYQTIKQVQATAGNQQNTTQKSIDLQNENKAIKDQYNRIMAQNNEVIKQMNQIKTQNEELSRKNKELTDDNIALQNSVKAAASVGIKPQNYTRFNGITSRGSIERGKYIGKFLGTAYTPSNEECGNNKGITNSGEPIIPGISIAIDNKYWPFGTVFYIRGLGYAVAMDTGSAIKGKNRFDFAVFDKDFANTLGAKYWDVYLVKLGKGNADKIQLLD